MGYDFFHLPPSQKSDVQVFSPTAYATNVQWQTWEKPRGVSFVHIVAVSGGCGGGAGAVDPLAVAPLAGGRGGGVAALPGGGLSEQQLRDAKMILHLHSTLRGLAAATIGQGRRTCWLSSAKPCRKRPCTFDAKRLDPKEKRLA